MNIPFEKLGVHTEFIHKLKGMDINEPTAIQSETIPAIIAGSDVIAQSQTGTGKTLAYLLPVLQRIDAASNRLQAVVIVPTQELGWQILRVIEILVEGGSIRAQGLIGGAALSRQAEKLKLHPHIVVGTPGRLNELVKINKLNVHHITGVVVDEADQVFNLGSTREVENVLKGMMKSRQMMFFSATIPDNLVELSKRWMNEPLQIRINPEKRTSEALEHLYFVCERRDKIDTLRRLVKMYNPTSAIVFVNAAADISEVLGKLQYVGLSVDAIYGEAGKQERANVMNAFRAGKFQLLLASDVAARGLDITGVTHVFNLDPPVNAEYYLHRVGRTGRMGRSGTAVSIVVPQELFIIKKFEKALRIKIMPKAMYEGKEVEPGSFNATNRPKESNQKEKIDTATPRRFSNEAIGSKMETSRSISGNRDKGTGTQANAKMTPVNNKRKQNKERDRKNKGAPKWLKEKQNKEK